MEEPGHSPEPNNRPEVTGFPELEEQLRDVKFLSQGFPQKLLISNDVRSQLLNVAGEVVSKGTLTDQWHLEGEEPKTYQIQFESDEASQLLNAVGRFFKQPFHEGAFDQALSDDLSNLLMGQADRSRYQEVPNTQAEELSS